MNYTVETFRAHGMEARWGRTRTGAPIIFARDPQGRCRHQREQWWAVDAGLWVDMQRIGIREAFDLGTILGDFFSVPA